VSFVVRTCRWLLKPAVILQDRLSQGFFSRFNQVVIDVVMAALSLFMAYQLRFDAAVPAQLSKTMYLWLLLLPALRALMLAAVGVYQMAWRYFHFHDALRVAFGAMLGTVVMLGLRVVFPRAELLANPASIIVIDAAIFVMLASMARGLRRAMAEEAPFLTADRKRLLLVGRDEALPAALHQVAGFRNLEAVGLLVPGCDHNGLRGLRINGCPVLGSPTKLHQLLEQRKADLILVTDASLECIGDVVSVATQHSIEVRLLPSAANVMQGEVRIKAPRQPSTRVERVLVLGGAGYLGSVLVPMLLARGYKVRVLDRLLFGPEPLDGVRKHPHFELIEGDVRDIKAVVGAVKDCDAVIDLAAIVGDPACAVNKQLSLEVNRAATRMLIEISKGYGLSRFVFASTCSVYGASDYLVDELTGTAPISIYAETKVSSEQLLIQAASENFQPVILRLGTLFGLSPRPRFDLVVNLLAAKAAAQGKITIFNGEQWRPFLHVHDAARAFVVALEGNPEALSGEIFNVGDYRLNLRLSQVSGKISELLPPVQVEHVHNGDKRNYRVSFDKIHTRLGFTCEKTIESGIREICEAVDSHQITDFTAERFNNHLVTKTFAESSSEEEPSLRLLTGLNAA
jgi:nucleoside-diphosphate-sugar epimerase